MKKYDELWQDINTLLAFLRGFHSEKAFEEYFGRYYNHAPSKLLKEQIEQLQKKAR